MSSYVRSIARLSLLVAMTVAEPLLAQGVTGSALTGTVTSPEGKPVAAAGIQLRNPSTGDNYRTVSNASGVYFIDNIPPGGPYTIATTAEGFEMSKTEDVTLSLGQRLTLDIHLRKELVEEIAVVGHADANADKGRTGPSTIRKSAEIDELPLQGRNFTSLIGTDPRVIVTGDGFSVAGQNSRFNNIQIDGGANNDIFGLAGNGTPGGTSNAKPISLEAIQEFVVQVAPFDVRLGDFAGGLVNAITKSGTNEFQGGLFGYYQNKAFTGRRDDPNYTGYYTGQYGGFLSGPIIKDEAHFFITADLQSREAAFGSPYFITGDDVADRSRVGFVSADVQRFTSILQTKYGINNVGDASSPNQGNPDHNLFVKITSNQIPNSRLELSYNFVNANQDNLSHTPTGVSVPFFLSGGYEMSNSGYGIANITNTARVKLTTNWDDSRFSNEFLGSASFIRDSRSLANDAPLILVKVGTLASSDSFLSAGAERFSQANALDQNIFQLQDNLTYALDQHRITVGTSTEFLGFRNVFLQAGIGAWEFDSLDALQAGAASAYQKRFSVSAAQAPGTARFSVTQPGFYAQDEYRVLENLSLTGGVRVDVPLLSTPITDTIVLNNSPLAIDTSKVPSGNALWSPRAGFNWDVRGNSDTIIRGGLGIFSGRPPYVFVSNAYTINGLSQVALTCGAGGRVPAFTPDPKAQPTDCNGGTGIPAPPKNVGEIDYFDPNTKYPQNVRYALGADQRLPWWGLLASADLLYTRDVNEFYTTDANLNVVGTDGEGRTLYGTFAPSAATFKVTPSRIDTTTVTNAVKVYNKGGGNTTSATIQVQKPFAKRFGVSVAYTYSRSVDRMSFTSSQALSNFRFAPVDGSLEDRNVRPSAFDRPHKITITGTAALPYGFGVGLSYVGVSGTPYTWVVNGDINGDGQSSNDTPFIPANASQISLRDPTQYAALASFINSQQCLKDAMGSLLQRGACRNPWADYFDARLSWTSPNWKGQHIEVQWDIFNVLNLINSDWGHYNQVATFETADTNFLRAVGYDTANKRPIYTFSAPAGISSTIYSPTQSRWRMQFGARYLF